LNVISFSFPHLSDGSLPSWVPDWSLRPDTYADAEMGNLSGGYNANGVSGPFARIDIYKGVLTVGGIEMATVIHFRAQPTTSWKEPSFSSLSQGLGASMDETEAIRAAFYTALKLAMSDSNSMPHSHKSSEIKIKEFALTVLCNNYDNNSLDPSFAFCTNQGRVRPSE
jgi:hypothetical protein